MGFLKEYKYYSIIALMNLTLFVSATIHRLQLNISESMYVNNILIAVEVLLVFVLMVLTLVNLIILIANLIKKKWREAIVCLCVIGVTLIMVVISMQIDAPTLIYAT